MLVNPAFPPLQVRVLGWTNDLFDPTGHDIAGPTLHCVTATCFVEWDGLEQPRRIEPQKCLGWHWKTWAQVTHLSPLFLSLANFISQPRFVPPRSARLARIRMHTRGRTVFLIAGSRSGNAVAQAGVLTAQLGLEHLNPDELFQREAGTGTAVGRRIRELTKRGEPLPADLTFPELRRELARVRYRDGVLIEGYPNDLESLDLILAHLGDNPGPAAALICQGADDTFDETTAPIIWKFGELGLLETIDASLSPDRVNKQVLEAIERRLCPPEIGSWWVSGGQCRGAVPATELSTKWHNCIDAEHSLPLIEIVTAVAARHRTAQQQVCPISHLFLGPQCTDHEFEAIYHRPKSFNPINVAVDQAFTTAKMGEVGLDYEMTRTMLEACVEHPWQGVMAKVEEDLWGCELDRVGQMSVTRDDGDSTASIDYARLGENWRALLVIPVCQRYALVVDAGLLHHRLREGV